MSMIHFNTTQHQQNQINIIDKIEDQIKNNKLQSSVVSPITNYENDPRIALTSVHFPKHNLIQTIIQSIVTPLQIIEPHHFYYLEDSLHITIKNVKVIHDPPLFSSHDIAKVISVFEETIPKYRSFYIYFYKLILFPHSLALIATTDPELNRIILDLDAKLKKAGVADDKQYINTRFFFSNMTLVRFTSQIGRNFIEKVNELSNHIAIQPYKIDSVTLLSSNAVLKNRTILGKWNFKQLK